jgi:putative SbcD/Mre11-related phosphoesterase
VEEINLGDLTLSRYFMLYLEEYDTAVMADFHLGYEDVMAQKGIFLPKLQYPYILDLLDKIFEKYEPRKVIIDGDLKHEFSRNMPQEWEEIESIIDFFLDRSELVVVRGNHDNFLKGILRRRGIEMHEFYTMGPYIFAHGHKDIDLPEDRMLIMAHEHPSITLRDEVYATIKLPCFLYSKKIIVLPAVSLYAAGTDITRNDFISPILKKRSVNFEVFGIDEKDGIIPLGTSKGKII